MRIGLEQVAKRMAAPNKKPEDFVSMRFLDELEKGFYKKLSTGVGERSLAIPVVCARHLPSFQDRDKTIRAYTNPILRPQFSGSFRKLVMCLLAVSVK